MKTTITTAALLLALCAPLAAQSIRITGFRQEAGARSALVQDDAGRPCALLRMKTGLQGWNFEAGLYGIVDVIPGDGCVSVYVPATARSITVSREGAGPLRDWAFPELLREGASYVMRLELMQAGQGGTARSQRAGVKGKQMKPATSAVPFRPGGRTLPAGTDPSRTFSRHFLDGYVGLARSGGSSGETFIGLRYTWLQDRMGPYSALAVSTDGSGAFFAGAAFRLTDPSRHEVDVHLYGGLGVVGGDHFAGEAGIRLGWKSNHALSGLDLGVGCQLWNGTVTPTLEVGFYMWGIPVTCALCFCMGVI